ncbi:hypothetical protein MAPG_04064 [Magnaporthiopsis poae ATCC 64411]|uniref:RNA polymerase-associated protein LEO1 n=1 Tax=Magnaporthiopsis poae (strain ATCC 64411 / 73-15) TaxID=644358 RepID=A0A0C4DVQ4_MAGP6|nr:hypothetical protein MAPG_04064 [Magnaporthiopsis poae ATCC 64411]
MSDSEDPVDVPEGGDDLFGEESDNERPLSDHELDDDDDDRQRDEERGGEDDGPVEFKQTRVQDQVVYRHRVPKPKDGVLRTMRIPDFLRVIPEEYNADTYRPTEVDLAEDRKKYPASAIRWRRNPETGRPESNAAIYRWSDGSVTLAVGDQHYEVDVKSLAPPAKSYDARRDANYYAAAAHLSSNMMLDEEISHGEDDEEEELLDDDDDEEERRPPRAKRQRTAESADEDADGDDDAPAAHADQAGRRGRRHIVDDDDE